ncbi:NTP transferase domain-containing protein [Nocardia aurantiaca]|uniref:NTP transferase domain-containing protein n=1 Tax=Nocardia aurantiaca TaxID=2675850 RepID=UPI0018AB1F89|nr:NTP transferase domain-containing protein [Nocardia aurantiaca]
MSPERCDGILLAAGAGRRYGMPKVLAEGGAWLRAAVDAPRGGGRGRIFVVPGATGPAQRGPDEVRMVSQTSGIAIPEGVQPIWATDWELGSSASTRSAMAATGVGIGERSHETAGRTIDSIIAARIDTARNTPARNSGAWNADTAGRPGPAEFVAIMPADTPDVRPAVVERVVAAARASESRSARTFFGTTRGHPVVLERAHRAGVRASAAGNSGAGTYLRQRADMVCVTCDDLATGIDRDYPADSAL